jgi:hypothetical protein
MKPANKQKKEEVDEYYANKRKVLGGKKRIV